MILRHLFIGGLSFFFLVNSNGMAAANSGKPDYAKKFSTLITEKYQEILSPLHQPPLSDGANLKGISSYLDALYVSGRFSECSQVAEKSLAHRSASQDPTGLSDALFVWAQCDSEGTQIGHVRTLYERLTSAEFQNAPNRAGHVFAYARFLLQQGDINDGKAILSRYAGWTGDKLDLANATLIYFAAQAPSRSQLERIKEFVTSGIESSDLALGEQLALGWLTHLVSVEGNHESAIQFAHDYRGVFKHPGVWVSLLYNAFYSVNQDEFSSAQKIYKAYLPYVHPLSWLPTEQNPYTYTELYQNVCASTLLQGEEYKSYRNQIDAWAKGTTSKKELLEWALSYERSFPNRADLLTLIGNFLHVTGQSEKAIDYYWQAHLACPYYNRAHWGLKAIHRHKAIAKSSGYEEQRRHFLNVSKNLVPPQGIEKYFLNWNSLEQEEKQSILYAARIWLPYMSQMSDQGSAYIKQPFQLLSEVHMFPKLIRDTRMTDPPNDNRLWDDVRAMGGFYVIADLTEVSEAPYGIYNLLGHELAHHFHRLLFATSNGIYQCISKLYQSALERKVFVNSYAGSNVSEYFAEGVTYFLINEDASARFGVNRAWFKENDPGLFQLLSEIESGLPIASLTCPINTTH